jgi:hypothetical protein
VYADKGPAQDTAPAAQPAQGPDRAPDVHPRGRDAARGAVADEASRDGAFELTRSLIDKVVVTPAEGDLHIDLHGELAGILTLAANKERPLEASDPSVQQVKVVAGEDLNLRPSGYEPDELPDCSTPRCGWLPSRPDARVGGRRPGKGSESCRGDELLARPGDDPLSHR